MAEEDKPFIVTADELNAITYEEIPEKVLEIPDGKIIEGPRDPHGDATFVVSDDDFVGITDDEISDEVLEIPDGEIIDGPRKIPPSPTTLKKTDSKPKKRSKSSSSRLIREKVRKSLQDALTTRRAEDINVQFTENDIKNFADETEMELHELFKDVGVKYKTKYRSLMFNIKDRKNLSLWKKICDKSISPKQLVGLSPEELARQELAEWRDNEAKHQLELIKKSELDLLAASKTYVLKSHKGVEVIKSNTAVATDLDPNIPVEDIVSALNDPSVNEQTPSDTTLELGDSSYKKSSVDSDGSRRRSRSQGKSNSRSKSKSRSRSDDRSEKRLKSIGRDPGGAGAEIRKDQDPNKILR